MSNGIKLGIVQAAKLFLLGRYLKKHLETTPPVTPRPEVPPPVAPPPATVVPEVRPPELARLTFIDQAPEVPIEELMNKIEAEKNGRQSTYFDLIPMECQENIITMAEKAFQAKGQGRSGGEFREAMSLNWLLKQATFNWVVRASAFRERTQIAKDEKCQILALTRNGSFLALSAPGEGVSTREIFYARVPGRVETKLPEVETRKGELKEEVILGNRLNSTVFCSSQVISLAANKSPDVVLVRKTSLTLSGAFIKIDRRTLN